MNPHYLTIGNGGLYLHIHAQPGAKQTALRGLHGDAIKLAIKEAPQDGKANKAIEVFVAKALGIAKSSVNVTSGHTSRSKRLFVEGDTESLSKAVRIWVESN